MTKVVIDNEEVNPDATQRQAERSGDGRDLTHRSEKQSPLMM
jgi:hypothetical protein